MDTYFSQPKMALYLGFAIDKKVIVNLEKCFSGSGIKLRVKRKLLARVVIDLLDVSMKEFFLKPLELIGADGAGEKIVTVGVKSVKRIIGVLVSSLTHRLTEDELDMLAQYMFSLVLCKNDNYWLASSLSTEIDECLSQIVDRLADEEKELEAVKQELVEILLSVSYSSIDVFFRKPLNMLELSYFSRKATLQAVGGTEAAVRRVIGKVVLMMTWQQLGLLACYIGGLRLRDSKLESLAKRGRITH